MRFQDSMVERTRALPGVTAAAFINDFPLGGGFYANGTLVEMSRPDEFKSWDPISAMSAEERAARSTLAGYRLAGPGYFEAMRIPLVRGRLIEEQDGPETPHVAVISESLAKARWPDRDPLGRYIQFGNMDGDFRGIRVVGVVKDVRELSPEALPQPTLYAGAPEAGEPVFSRRLRTRPREPQRKRQEDRARTRSGSAGSNAHRRRRFGQRRSAAVGSISGSWVPSAWWPSPSRPSASTG